MLEPEGATRSKPFNITELRASSSRNRYKLIADPKSCEEMIATLAQEFDKHCFQALEAFWDDWVQIVFPYFFRAAEAGATFFPRARLPEGVLRHDQVRPSVCTRSDLLVWTGSDLFKSLCDEWDYYHAQGFDNTIVRVDDGFTWFLTW